MTKRISAIESAEPTVTRMPPNEAFGRIIGTILIVLGFSPMIFGRSVSYIPLGIGILLLVMAELAPVLLTPLNRAWAKLGEILHSFISPLVLGIVFVLAVIPTGIFMRMSGKDPLRQKRRENEESYWIVRDPAGPSPDSMKQQF